MTSRTGSVDEAADVRVVTGHHISPQVSCCLDDHCVHHVAGTSTAQQLASSMCFMLCQAQYVAAAQQSTKLNLRRRPADLGDDRGRHHREYP